MRLDACPTRAVERGVLRVLLVPGPKFLEGPDFSVYLNNISTQFMSIFYALMCLRTCSSATKGIGARRWVLGAISFYLFSCILDKALYELA